MAFPVLLDRQWLYLVLAQRIQVLQSINVRIGGCYCSVALVRVAEDCSLDCGLTTGDGLTISERNGGRELHDH